MYKRTEVRRQEAEVRMVAMRTEVWSQKHSAQGCPDCPKRGEDRFAGVDGFAPPCGYRDCGMESWELGKHRQKHSAQGCPECPELGKNGVSRKCWTIHQHGRKHGAYEAYGTNRAYGQCVQNGENRFGSG